MVSVNDLPFLYILMKRLESQGFHRIVLSLCYRADYIIQQVINDKPVECIVDFVVEPSPLGTGGAIKLAAQHIKTDKFIVLNGDTYCDIDYQALVCYSKQADLVISAVYVDDVSRYGTLDIDRDQNVLSLQEKGRTGSGYINSGTYVINTKDIIHFFDQRFSFEDDYVRMFKGAFKAYLSNGYFIDIGIPEDYYKLCENLK